MPDHCGRHRGPKTVRWVKSMSKGERAEKPQIPKALVWGGYYY